MRLIQHPGAIGEIFNIGGNEEVSIETLARTVKEVLNSSSPIVYIPYAEAYEEGFEDMHKRVPDISKIQNLIGYEPKCELKDIIRDVAEYRRNRGSLAHRVAV